MNDDADDAWTPADEWRATAGGYEVGADHARVAAVRESDAAAAALLLRAAADAAASAAGDAETAAARAEAAAAVDDTLDRLVGPRGPAPDADDPLPGRPADGRAFDDEARRLAVDVAHLAGGGSVGALGDPDARGRAPGAVLRERATALRDAVRTERGLVDRVSDRTRGRTEATDRETRASRLERYAATHESDAAAQALLFGAGERLARAAAERPDDESFVAGVETSLDAVETALAAAADVETVDARVSAPVSGADAVRQFRSVLDAVEPTGPVDGDRAADAFAAAEGAADGTVDPATVGAGLDGYPPESEGVADRAAERLDRGDGPDDEGHEAGRDG